MPWNPDGTRKTGPLYMKGAFKMKSPYPKHVEHHLAGQFLEKTEGGYKDVDTGKNYTDPNNIVNIDNEGNVVDDDYKIEGNVIVSMFEPEEKDSK